MIIHFVPDCLHDARMSYYDAVIAILTILVSLALVIILVGAAWWLMWKVGCLMSMHVDLVEVQGHFVV